MTCGQDWVYLGPTVTAKILPNVEVGFEKLTLLGVYLWCWPEEISGCIIFTKALRKCQTKLQVNQAITLVDSSKELLQCHERGIGSTTSSGTPRINSNNPTWHVPSCSQTQRWAFSRPSHQTRIWVLRSVWSSSCINSWTRAQIKPEEAQSQPRIQTAPKRGCQAPPGSAWAAAVWGGPAGKNGCSCLFIYWIFYMSSMVSASELLDEDDDEQLMASGVNQEL